MPEAKLLDTFLLPTRSNVHQSSFDIRKFDHAKCQNVAVFVSAEARAARRSQNELVDYANILNLLECR